MSPYPGEGGRWVPPATEDDVMRKRTSSTDETAEEWFGIAELARRLDVSEDLIRRKVQRHEVPYYKVGKLIRFNSNEIKQWLASLRIDPLF
jgi:excisionase family DNA binding protein